MKELERAVCAAVCRHDGVKAREIARELGLERSEVNRVLCASPLLKELCWQDRDYCWHGLVKQAVPHSGLEEFAAWYGRAGDFVALDEAAWMEQMTAGCVRIGRNVNDTRGLLHSFRDCRETVLRLFTDLREMLGEGCLGWELAFELRLKRSRHVRISVEPEEVEQAAKYAPYLEIVFGAGYEIIPVLVLTRARELFNFVSIGGKDRVLPVCAGDMLFNVFDEYLGFLH